MSGGRRRTALFLKMECFGMPAPTCTLGGVARADVPVRPNTHAKVNRAKRPMAWRCRRGRCRMKGVAGVGERLWGRDLPSNEGNYSITFARLLEACESVTECEGPTPAYVRRLTRGRNHRSLPYLPNCTEKS